MFSIYFSFGIFPVSVDRSRYKVYLVYMKIRFGFKELVLRLDINSYELKSG